MSFRRDTGRAGLLLAYAARRRERRERAMPLNDDTRAERFDAVCAAHLDAAYNLARWLLRDASHAEDVVQEACLRAFRYFDSYDGRDARVWFLAIVRNACY